MSLDIIYSYIDEFHNNPQNISEYKIIVLKDFYYENINSIFPVKRNNFQIGVNKNTNLLFFRDRTNKSRELILNIINQSSNINIRKQISYSFDSIKLDDTKDQVSSSILIQKSIDNLNSKVYNDNSNYCKCNYCFII